MRSESSKWPQWPYIDNDMIKASSDVLHSGKVNYWTGDTHILPDGTKVRGETGLFEYEFSSYHDIPYSISLANGTLALELALKCFGIGLGDEVITTNRTFIASASAVVMAGALPVFADIDRMSQNISAKTIEPLITAKTKAIICVHLAGWSCEMDEIKTLLEKKSNEFGEKIILIEDCAQSLGGEYRGRKLGTIGDAGCFSFCQDKIITTGGEGGMLILKDEEAYKSAWSYKDHGKNFDKYNSALNHPLVNDATSKKSYYTSLGTNWRMTEFQAAIGRVALKKLDSWNLFNRKRFAKFLDVELSCVKGLKVLLPPPHISHAYYKYYVYLELELFNDNWGRERVINELNNKGVPCFYGSTWNISAEDAWENVELNKNELENLKSSKPFSNDSYVGNRALMFQVHPNLELLHMKKVVETLKMVLTKALS